ncbi:transposase, partial [Chloroflexota bacterium]
MTRGSVKEYVVLVRGRYHRASKKEKGRILDEFTEVVGCYRKSAIWLLMAKHGSEPGRKRGRCKEYGADVGHVLRLAWEATDRLCFKRLHPFLPHLIPVLKRYSDSFISAEVEAQVCCMGPS